MFLKRVVFFLNKWAFARDTEPKPHSSLFVITFLQSFLSEAWSPLRLWHNLLRWGYSLRAGGILWGHEVLALVGVKILCSSPPQTSRYSGSTPGCGGRVTTLGVCAPPPSLSMKSSSFSLLGGFLMTSLSFREIFKALPRWAHSLSSAHHGSAPARWRGPRSSGRVSPARSTNRNQQLSCTPSSPTLVPSPPDHPRSESTWSEIQGIFAGINVQGSYFILVDHFRNSASINIHGCAQKLMDSLAT